MHVIVENPQSSDSTLAWATFIVAFATLAATIGANVIALRDFRLNIEQYREQLRRPLLTLLINAPELTTGGAVFLPILPDAQRTTLLISMSVRNAGNRQVPRFRAEFLVPYFERPDNNGETDLQPRIGQFGLQDAGSISILDENAGNYTRYTIEYEQPVMPESQIPFNVLILQYPSIERTFVIRWRLSTGEFVFPENGQYGIFHFTIGRRHAVAPGETG